MKDEKRQKNATQKNKGDFNLRDIIGNEETLHVTFKTIKGGPTSNCNREGIPDFWTGVFNKTLATVQSIKARYNGSSASLPSTIVTNMILKEIIEVRGE